MFRLMSRPCDQCLVTKDRIVPGSRAAEIVAKVSRTDSHFICHKSKPGRANEIVCRGVEDKVGPCQLHRIMGRLGAIVEIDPETLKPVTAQVRTDNEAAQ